MIVSEAIKMLEKAKEEYGDLPVFIDMDYGQRVLEEDTDPLCKVPNYEKEASNLPARIVI